MASPTHQLQLIGREHYVNGILERLKRPDDVRDSPKDFAVKPGFFGLGGIGKTRLLQEIAARARSLTPYVIYMDIDAGKRGSAPTTPLTFMIRLLSDLQEIEQKQRTGLRRLWRRKDPLQPCLDVLLKAGRKDVVQYINAQGSHLHDIAMTVGQESLPPNLLTAFQEALPNLSHKAIVAPRINGEKAPARPVVLLLLDTYELAAQPLAAWLEKDFFVQFNRALHHWSLLVVLAGRQRQPHLVEQELPALTPTEAATFVRAYLGHRQRSDDRYILPSTHRTLTDHSPLLERLLTLGEGIPLLLQLLTDIVAAVPDALAVQPDTPPADHETRLTYVLTHYLKRLSTLAAEDERLRTLYLLMTQAAVPVYLPKAGLLRALLPELTPPGQSPLLVGDQLWQRLARQAYIQERPDGLHYHALVRRGILHYLAAEAPDLLHELHRRAAAWFQANGGQSNYLYHAFAGDYARASQELHATVQQAQAASAWEQVSVLLNLTSELPLQHEERAWTIFYAAELAWHKQQPAVAEAKLLWLIHHPIPAPLQPLLAARLAAWFDFAPTLRWDDVTSLSQNQILLLRWWAATTDQQAVEAHARLKLGEVAYWQARYGEAVAHYQAALALYDAVADRLGQATARGRLGEVALSQARYDEAEAHYQAALALSEAMTDRLCLAQAIRNLGEVALRQARYGEAEAHYQAALALYDAAAARMGQAHASLQLGQVAQMQARYDEAEAHYQAALTLSEAMADRLGLARARLQLGEVALRHARYSEAEAHLQAALALYEAMTDRLGLARARLQLGEVAQMQARYGEAAAHLQAALALSEAMADRLGQAYAHLKLGEVARMQARYGEAEAHLQATLALSEAMADRLGQASAHRNLGEVALGQARYDEAEAHLQAALALSEAMADRLGLASARLNLGEVAQRQARYGEAEAHLQAALALSEAMADRLGQANAHRNLGEVAQRQVRYGEARRWYADAFALILAIHLPRYGADHAIRLAFQALEQAQRHRLQGEDALCTEALALARDLGGWGRQFLPQIPGNVSVGNLSQRLQTLFLQLDELDTNVGIAGSGHALNWQKEP